MYRVHICNLFITLLIMSITNVSLATEDPFQQLTLRTGFYLQSIPDIALADMEVALRFWSEEVGKHAGFKAFITIYKSLDQMRTDFYQGKINFIVSSPLPIVDTFDPALLADGYKIVHSDTSAKNQLLIITHKNSGVNHFKDIKNKQLSILISDPISEMFVDLLSLKYFGKQAKEVFPNIDRIQRSNQLIFKLFFKKTDMILVYRNAYQLAIELNPQIKSNTRVISRLANIPRGLGFFHRKVNPKFRESVLAEMEKLETHPRGRQLMALFHAEKIQRSSIADLKTTQQLKKKYLQLIDRVRKQ